jgi:hypothetical protein
MKKSTQVRLLFPWSCFPHDPQPIPSICIMPYLWVSFATFGHELLCSSRYRRSLSPPALSLSLHRHFQSPLSAHHLHLIAIDTNRPATSSESEDNDRRLWLHIKWDQDSPYHLYPFLRALDGCNIGVLTIPNKIVVAYLFHRLINLRGILYI